MVRFLKVTVLLAVLVGVAFGARAAYRWWKTPTTLAIAVSGYEPDDARMMAAFSRKFVEDDRSVRLRVVTVASQAEAAEKVMRKEVDLAVVRADIPLSDDALAIAILRKTPVTLVSSSASRIETPAGLKGKRLGIVGEPGLNLRLAKALLKAYSLSESEVGFVPVASSQVAAFFLDKRIDAVLATPVVAAGRVRETARLVSATRRMKLRFLDIDQAAFIAQREPAFVEEDLAAGAFGADPKQPDEDLSSLKISTYVVANRAMANNVAAQIARQIVGDKQAIATEANFAGLIEAAPTEKDAFLRAHPGAAAYFDGDEQSFLDLYSDRIYYGGVLFGVLFSAGAAIAQSLRSSRREGTRAFAQELLDFRRELDASPPADSAALAEARVRFDALADKAVEAISDPDEPRHLIMAIQTSLALAERALDRACARKTA